MIDTEAASAYTRAASAGESIAPVGLCGVLTTMTFVLGVINFSSASTS